MECSSVDLHDICIEGDYSLLKELIEGNSHLNVNEYKLFLYHRNPRNSRENDDDFDRDDEDFQSDDNSSNVGQMFDYRSPLFNAIYYNHLSCVKLLLQSGADPKHLRPWGLNCLCLSTYLGHQRLVEYLLDYGLNMNETDKPNSTDHYFQCLPSTNEHKEKLKEMHFRVAQDLGMFHYPLHIAIKQDSISLIQLFLRFKSNIDFEQRESYTKKTALHLAAEKCSIEIIRLLLEEGHSNENPLDFNGHTPLDIIWKLLNNLDYQFEYREETLKLMLSHRCRFSSLRSLTEFYANSLSAFRRFESNFWIVIAYHLPSIFLETFPNNKTLLVHIWIWFNRNYQDTIVDQQDFDRHYTGSILRNLIHVMYDNQQLTLTKQELIQLFTEDLGSHFDKATDEIDTITTILSTPLKLKQISRNRIRQRLCLSTIGGLNRETLEHSAISAILNAKLQHFILP